MQKAYNKTTISLKEQLHELEEVLNNADPVLDKDLITSKKNEVLCLVMSHKDYLSRRIKLPKGGSGSYSVEDAFSDFMVYFIEWLNKKYPVKQTAGTYKQNATHNNGDHIFALVMMVSRLRGLDGFKKKHSEISTSFEVWLTDDNGNKNDHNELLAAGDQYKTEDSIVQMEMQNSLPDSFFVDLLSQIMEYYKSREKYKKASKMLDMFRIFFSRDVMAFMHGCDAMPKFEHSREIGNNTKEPFVNYCLQKHVSYEEEGRFVLPGMYKNPYKAYLDLISRKALKDMKDNPKIWNMEKRGIPDSVIEGYFDRCCNIDFGGSAINPNKKTYESLRVIPLNTAIPGWAFLLEQR